MEDNRRKQKREIIDFFLDVHDASSGEFVGHMVDLTSEGMRLISRQKHAIGDTYRLQTTVPGTKDKKYVEFDGVVRWSSKEENDYFAQTGLQVSGIEPAMASKIVEELNRNRTENGPALPAETLHGHS